MRVFATMFLPFALMGVAHAQETGQGPVAPGGGEEVEAPAEPTKALTISGNVALVSDYRFRGVSLSDKDIAIQGSIRVDHESGLYLATWASSIEQLAGAETEVDVYGGWSKDIGGVKPDIGVIGYLYPGGQNVDYFEVYAALTGDIGPVSATAGVNYQPDQKNYDGDNTYVFGSLSAGIPNTPLSVAAKLGYEDGVFAPDSKLDWQIGASLTYEVLTLNVSYIDTDREFRLGDGGVVVSLTAAF